ncbi:MAG: RagB/SusD family nutrient uptake outer membrane protein [Candidatus Pedobacter colombiensis]|uniref:RagB/SusD family nutrient uptake outer membrane protein n=1 Tax=Candidatus Pedobacter colombiensis TaxID=3121371 RepID=A0AAJ5W795_9SPHI|nr:RagB/SusD family nutrient uptake outer membrane protein [Pedobacter sp.]WEK17847.1 MAG: RagB/SusD family nutrient uptake outer membrane protein [Pedobacter sp.]
MIAIYMKKMMMILVIFAVLGCTKKLDLKPDSLIVVPKSAKDLQLILDNTDVMNVTPNIGHVSADEYFFSSLQAWQSLYSPVTRAASVWQKDIYAGVTQVSDWIRPYSTIYYSNTVLDILASQDISNDNEKRVLKGWALFARAYAYYNLVSLFSKAYDPLSASQDLGVPLKLNANIDEILQRSTLEQCYNQIILDAKAAGDLLQQDIISNKRSRPSKVAAYALLARVYLNMGKFTEAEAYADKTLSLYSTLTDYNLISKTADFGLSFNSEEIIYLTSQYPDYDELNPGLETAYGIVPELINLYNPSDLRLPIYFQKNTLGNYNIRSVYTGSSTLFSGLATDEIYLIKAECLARRGETLQSMSYLNQLGIKRWNPNATSPSKPYENLIANTPEIALDKVLIERRKALVFRGIRWTDLKRLNVEGRNITITRKLDDQIFTLEPNSPRYVLPIPDDEVALSGVAQNVR